MDNFNLPPQALEAEHSALGALMLNAKDTDDAISLLSGDDFYQHSHQLIFNAIQKLHRSDKPVDVIVVSEQLDSEGSLENAGGMAYLGTITKNTPNTNNLLAYAKIIKEKSLLRRIIQDAQELIGSAYNASSGEAQSIVDMADRNATALIENATTDGAQHISKSLTEALNAVEERWKSDGTCVGVPTGFKSLDEKILGLENGEVYVIAGRPGMGKTVLAVNMAKNIGLSGGKSLFISLEMPVMQLVNRLFSSFGINHDTIRSGKLHNDDWSKLTNATSQLMESGIFVDDTPALSANRIDAIARKLFKKQGKMPIFLDYLQIMGSETSGNRFEEVTAFSQKLKAIAKRHGVPVVLLSQLNRTCESRQDKRPETSDLRESGAIEQDASTIMFLYRDEVYTKEKSAFKGEAELIITKQRNGVTGVVPLVFNGAFQRFETMNETQEASFWNKRSTNDQPLKRVGGLG